jgi:hypothetical protein
MLPFPLSSRISRIPLDSVAIWGDKALGFSQSRESRNKGSKIMTMEDREARREEDRISALEIDRRVKGDILATVAIIIAVCVGAFIAINLLSRGTL